MTKAIIYRPVKTAMQSGKAKSNNWFLKFNKEGPKIVDNLMGWQGSSDMKQELNLKFETKESAIAYAEKQGIEFEVIEPKEKKITIQSYAENFTN